MDRSPDMTFLYLQVHLTLPKNKQTKIKTVQSDTNRSCYLEKGLSQFF